MKTLLIVSFFLISLIVFGAVITNRSNRLNNTIVQSCDSLKRQLVLEIKSKKKATALAEHQKAIAEEAMRKQIQAENLARVAEEKAMIQRNRAMEAEKIAKENQMEAERQAELAKKQELYAEREIKKLKEQLNSKN
jgi:hypothetical protein